MILVILLVVTIMISYIVIIASDLITLGKLASVSMVGRLLEDKVVVLLLQVVVVATLVPITL